MKVLIEPASLRSAAGTCRTLAHEIDDVGRRLTSLPRPDGMPGDAASELASIGAALGRSSRATGAQARWLDYRATAGLFADGPFGSGLFDFGGPPLLSPWDIPAPPAQAKPKKSSWDRFWDGFGDRAADIGNFGLGAGEGLWNLGRGGVETVVVGGAHLIDSRTGLPVSDRIPWVGDLRRDYDAGVKWAGEHPKEFAELMRDDLIAADEENTAKRAGRITVEIAGFVVTVSKLAKLGKLARVGKVPEPGSGGSGVKPPPKFGAKIEKQMESRGWDLSRVERAKTDPARVVETRDTRHLPGGGRIDDPATAYYSRDGGYFVINDRTGDVVQVSDRTKAGWKAPWD